jgi:SAM-dependent methyltransferase
MLSDAQDAMGHGLWDQVHGREASEICERDDGHVGAIPMTTYLRSYDEWSGSTKESLAFVRGRVLDVGVGGGQHAIHLQEKGHDVCGIDHSPLAVEVSRLRGLEDARGCPVTKVGSFLGPFDTILMMSNNFGLVGNPKRAPWLLKRFAAITTPEARIVAQSNDVYGTEKPWHLAYQQRNRDRGRLSGQIRLRIRYEIYTSPWFDYLMVSPDEMQKLLEKTPWKVKEVIDSARTTTYTAILEKR